MSDFSVDALLAAAREHAAQGNVAQAVQLSRKVLELAPDQPDALSFLGQNALTLSVGSDP